MKIAIGCDHAGIYLKPALIAYLEKNGYIVCEGAEKKRYKAPLRIAFHQPLIKPPARNSGGAGASLCRRRSDGGGDRRQGHNPKSIPAPIRRIHARVNDDPDLIHIAVSSFT